MKLFLITAIGALLLPGDRAEAQSLIEATNSADAAEVIRSAGADRDDLIRDAVGLGIADPVDLIFALVTPATAAGDADRMAHVLTLTAPRRADEVAASTAIAAGIVGNEGRLITLISALLDALAAAPLDDAAREEEVREVLVALLSVAEPDLRIVLADAVAGGDGAALLATLGEGPETAAIDAPPRPFGEAPTGLTLTAGSAAQDAPSAN